ncbi:hypothetical protein [Methylomonas sp. UP202]|uniref:hypothetical protein n=1 Tax=Methylomonas sp. UP202 TaxID=3040943 RepID=UPI002478A774|nr:hypothetical protein [Methylomonas sp. UP202]WGS84460.1 hypothetical protein QC632_15530 [Methylomonas sp. UP202]
MNWIIPFKGRRHSGALNQNFLYQSSNIYVMDNHRAALWCWLNFYKDDLKDVGVFHLDRHSDAERSNLPSWVSQATSPIHVSSMDIQSYLDAVDKECPPTKLFRWDNYLSIFLDMYRDDINCFDFSVYEGDAINHPCTVKRMPWELPENISFWLSEGKWILNIDLDYFFYKVDESIEKMYSDEYLHSFFNKVSLVAKRDAEVVVTICFSPECCGSWAYAEKIWYIAESYLKTGLVLPP